MGMGIWHGHFLLSYTVLQLEYPEETGEEVTSLLYMTMQLHTGLDMTFLGGGERPRTGTATEGL